MFAERNYGCRVLEYEIHGRQAMSMENKSLRVGILPGWGCQIYELLDKRTDTDFMMRERRGLARLNNYTPSKEGPQGAFWDYMLGGWFEMFPNAGKSCEKGNIVYGQHGEVAYQPWDVEIIADDVARVALRFTVETMRTDFRLQRTMELRGDEPVLYVKEELTNQSPVPQEFIWGHHFTMGEAFLNKNCVIDAPSCIVADRNEVDLPASQLQHGSRGTLRAMPGKHGGFVDVSRVLERDSHINEMLYLCDMPEGWAAVTDTDKGVGVGLAWDRDIFPNAWLWKEFCAGKGFPLYGRCYAMSLEPCVTNIPTLKAASEAGQSRVLGGGASLKTWLTVAVHHEHSRVAGVSRNGEMAFAKEDT